MTKTAYCQTYKAFEHDKISLGGYTVLVVSTRSSLGVGMTIRDPNGTIISGISDTQPGYAHTGQIYLWPDNNDPLLSVRIDERGYDMLGFVRMDWAKITICIYTDTAPTPISETPPPPPPPEINIDIPPYPTLGQEPALNYSGLLPFIESIYNRLRWLFQYVLDSLTWIILVLGRLIPKIIELIVYILSLKWITDFSKQFIADLDIWISNKFGIDPAKPFFEELIKKALNWISAALDNAAENRIKIRKW